MENNFKLVQRLVIIHTHTPIYSMYIYNVYKCQFVYFSLMVKFFQRSPYSSLCYQTLLKNHLRRGFPSGSVITNLPASARDTGSIPGPGGTHMPWSNWVHETQLLSLSSRARELQLLKSVRPRAYAPQQEKPSQWEACIPQLEKSPCSNTDSAQAKINKKINKIILEKFV